MFVISADDLQHQVESGATVSVLAQRFAMSPAAVRRELRRLGLVTRRQAVLREASTARGQGLTSLVLRCRVHGELVHHRDVRGSYRCPRCSCDRVAGRRRRIKELLVEEAGGACAACGYDRCPRALSFHHLDPTTKEFGLAYGGSTRSLDRAREEAAKCILLCANCHMEVETGSLPLPLE